jgi:hypothetical protein
LCTDTCYRVPSGKEILKIGKIFMFKNRAKKCLCALLMAVGAECFAMELVAGRAHVQLVSKDKQAVPSEQVYALVRTVRANMHPDQQDYLEALPYPLPQRARLIRDVNQLFTLEGLFCVRCAQCVWDDGPHQSQDNLPFLSHTVSREHGIPDCVLARIATADFTVAAAFLELVKRADGAHEVDENKIKKQLVAKAFYLKNTRLLVSLLEMGLIPHAWIQQFQAQNRDQNQG